jgi:hypothetical protein
MSVDEREGQSSLAYPMRQEREQRLLDVGTQGL